MPIRITKFTDASCPGFIEFELVDRLSKTWRFVDKVPVIDETLDETSSYPRPGEIACRIVRRLARDEAGRELVEIDTSEPWGLETIEGETVFVVFADQLVERPDFRNA